MPTRPLNLIASIASLLVLAASAFAQAGQNPKPPEADDVVRVYSELVQTDVMVFDKQGQFVNGLKREDFELKIDGKRRPVEFFERIAAGTSDEDVQLSAARGVAVPGKGPNPIRPVPLDRGRTIFFYVDDLHLSAGSLLQMRKVLLRFVDQEIGQNDVAAITSASGTIGFLQQLSDNRAVLRAAIERLSPRSSARNDMQRPTMTEYQALQIDRQDRDVIDFFVDALLSEDPGLNRNLAGGLVRSRANQILQQSASNTTNTLVGLESLVRSSSKLSGRKLVFFISDGFFLDDQNSAALSRLRKVTSAAARSGVVIYSLDARGLVASLADVSVGATFDPTGRLARSSGGELLASQDAMNALAKDTGGRAIFNTNALDVGLKNALKETSTYYLLAWRPDREAATSEKFRRIAVSLVGHPDLTVRVRQGFFDREPPTLESQSKNKAQPEMAASKTEPLQSQAVLRDSFAEVYPKTDIPVAVNLSFLDVPTKGIVLTVTLQVNVDSLEFKNENGKLKSEVDLRGSVFNDHGKAVATFADRLTVDAPSLEKLQRGNKELIYNYQVYLPEGIFQVRVGARDPAGGKVGTAYEWIDVPRLLAGKLALSSVIIGERLPARAEALKSIQGALAGATRRVDGRFQRNSVLRLNVYIYNAALATDFKPDLGVQVQILRDREPVITTPSKRISTDGMQQFERLPYGGDLSLEGLAPGRYLLRISVVDRFAKTSAAQEVRFEIE
jgi:VWFA-related protein